MQCKTCSKTYNISNEEQDFYQKISVPVPQICPECRLIRRLCERNARYLYNRKCDFTGENILSQYHGEHPFPVYKADIWWSDKWDAKEYGKDFDFNRPFFEQFKELKSKTPHIALFQIGGTLENSDYTNCTGYLKNCYMISESDYNEDCYYANLLKKCKNVVDCSICYNNELCYECVDCIGCYNMKYSQDCTTCQDSYFLKDCKSCHDCIGCINQYHKEFMIFNKQYSEEEYKKHLKEFALNTNENIESLRKKAQEFFSTQPQKHLHQENNENSFGDHLYNSKNSKYCYDSKDLEDCMYCAKVSLGVKSSMDYNSWGDNAELIYECSACGDNIYNLKFCTTCTTNVSNSEYCDQCTGSDSLFGCIGLKKEKFCILNKQYSEEEYKVLKEKIVEHMRNTGEYGEYFPLDICPYGYNETIAMDYFPLNENQAKEKGYRWVEKEITHNPPTEEILACKKCSKNYKIIPQELKFYKQMDLPIPENCPDCRHLRRISLRNTPNLWEKKCEKCGKDVQTTFSPDRAEKVYCEECYLQEVV